ncbi:hypothetical protein [Nocardia asteroides]|uniref:hypothetical protein n=1 Tax=Nocardia asteroides TaxID=1824 RepID=UPI001E52485F|nr:hypothetical protein [Nocardia asteroides]UGT53768.1 hypothetical protein LTT85_24265 [Nocardia asteroides]
MSDNAFATVTTTNDGAPITARYSETTGMVVLTVGAVRVFLPVLDAATAADEITAALNAYTSTLLAVA